VLPVRPPAVGRSIRQLPTLVTITTDGADIPWSALFVGSKGPGDSFQFSVQVNEADSEGGGREAVLG